MKFSDRIGATLPKVAQVASMDIELRVGLWNVVELLILDSEDEELARTLAHFIWINHLKKPFHEIPDELDRARRAIRHIYYEATWDQAFNIIEYIAKFDGTPANAVHCFNIALERENSAYRFVEGELVPIAEQSDIDAVEDAFSSLEGRSNASAHLASALRLLGQKDGPDFRNSIKESISAVESVCQSLTGNSKATLADALKLLPDLHGALRKSLEHLYGYAGDGDGIRHALRDETTLSVVDARFVLITCSAFCSYLVAKFGNQSQSVRPP